LFKLGVGGGGQKLGEATYGSCEPCGVWLLYKIGFPPEWQYCGFGTLALETMEARHPRLTWFTTLQYEWAQGFYERRRRDNPSQWTANEPCQHFRREQSWDRTGTANSGRRRDSVGAGGTLARQRTTENALVNGRKLRKIVVGRTHQNANRSPILIEGDPLPVAVARSRRSPDPPKGPR